MSASRPAFDPSHAAGPANPVLSGPLTVTQLTRMIKAALDQHLPATLHVIGELSNVSCPASGHLYFTLKDETSEVRCVMWRSSAAKIKFEPTDGLAVVASGGIDVFEPRGQIQLYVRKIEPRGVGSLELAFRQLREKLEREGLFRRERKRALPTWPRRLAVVTSATGAAIRDILKVIRRRSPNVDVMILPVRVQGEGAAAEIADAIAALNRHAARLGGIDLMIVGRGGGSLEDLWAFNEEVVARAIFASEIPVVSAVGHETDVTISDLVADVRAPTPSAAAEMAVPRLDDVLERLAESARALHRHARHAVDVSTSRLHTVARHEWFRRPLVPLVRRAQQVDETAGRLNLMITRRLVTIRRELHRYEVSLSTIRPEAYVHQLHHRLLSLLRRLDRAANQAVSVRERRLSAGILGLRTASPQARIQSATAKVASVEQSLKRSVAHRMVVWQQRTQGLAVRLESVGYKQVLARGYSITRREPGRKLITSPAQVRTGQRIVTETKDGEFESRVVDKGQLELFD